MLCPEHAKFLMHSTNAICSPVGIEKAKPIITIICNRKILVDTSNTVPHHYPHRFPAQPCSQTSPCDHIVSRPNSWIQWLDVPIIFPEHLPPHLALIPEQNQFATSSLVNMDWFTRRLIKLELHQSRISQVSPPPPHPYDGQTRFHS